MYGANPSSLNKCCLARTSGVGSNLKPAGYNSGRPFPEPPKPWMCWSAADASKGALEGVHVTRRVLCAQIYANAQDTAMGAPVILLRRPQTNNIAVVLHAHTTSTEHSVILYCMLLWYTIVIIVLHIHTRVGTCSSCNDPVAITVISDTVWRHFWCYLQ